MTTFYYATLTEDTESDVDDEPSHPELKHIFWREDPKEEQVSSSRRSVEPMTDQQPEAKYRASIPSKAGPSEKSAKNPSFLTPSLPSAKERPSNQRMDETTPGSQHQKQP